MPFDIQKNREALQQAKEDYQPERFYRAAKMIQREAEEALQENEQAHEQKLKELSEETERYNPDNDRNKYPAIEGYGSNEISELRKEEEKRRDTFSSTVDIDNRTIDAETVAVMDYLKKMTLSRLEAEAKDHVQMENILQELAEHPDRNMRYVLIDHLSEISQSVKEIVERREFSVDMQQSLHLYYADAKENVKSETQKAYEQAKNSEVRKQSGLFSAYLVEKQNLQEFVNEINASLHGMDDPDRAKDFFE